MKVLDYTGLQNLWTNIKNYITAHTPTSTSELTNDSGFLTSTDISSKANDSEVLHKAQNETVTGEKTFKKDVKIIDLNANERPGVQFEVNGSFITFEQAKDALPDTDFGDFGVGTVWSAFWLNDNTKIQNSMSDYVINDITFGTTGVGSVIEFNNYYKVKYEEADNIQTDLRGMLRFELVPYAGVQKDSMMWTNPKLYFYAKLDNDEFGDTILGHEDARWSKAYIDEINCYEIKFGGNSIRDILENIISLSYVTHYSSTALTSNSTNSLSIIDNQDSVRVNDKVIDSSGKMFYITSVDLNNDEFEVGSVVDTFAKDSDVIHNSGNETKSGELTVTKLISNSIQSETGNVQVQSKGSNRSVAMYNGGSAGDGGGFWAYGKDSLNGSDCRMQIYNTAKSRYERVDLVNSAYVPTPTNEIECGSSTNKWKSFNGENPGSLSFPDFSNGIDISGYITIGTTTQTYTAPADGWILIQCRSSAASGCYIENSSGYGMLCPHLVDYGSNDRISKLCCPVKKNEVYTIVLKSIDISVTAYFYPCLGNI